MQRDLGVAEKLESVATMITQMSKNVERMKNEQHAKHLEMMNALESFRNMHEQHRIGYMQQKAEYVKSARAFFSGNPDEPEKSPQEPEKSPEEPEKSPEEKKTTDFLVKIWKAAEEDNQKFLAYLHTIPARGFEVPDVHEVMKIESIDKACKSYIWYCLLFAELHRDASADVAKECIDGMHSDIRSLLINSSREGAYSHCKDTLVRSTGKEFDPRHDRFVAFSKPLLEFLTSTGGTSIVLQFTGNPNLNDGDDESGTTGSKRREREDGEVQEHQQHEQQQQDNNNNVQQQEGEHGASSKRQKKEDQ